MLDWVFREDDDEDLSLAVRQVRQYERTSPSGKSEVVRGYQAQHAWWQQPRSWWIPHPDWERGQQEWITAGEKGWERTGKENWAAGQAPEWKGEGQARGAKDTAQTAERAQHGTSKAPRGGAETTRGAERAEHGTGKPVPSGAAPRPGLPEHGYLRPDPARLERTRGTYKKPQDHPFFKKNPLSADNVVKSFDESTPAERHQGMRWYEDGYRLAWALGGGDAAKGAGILSSLSPQTGWPINLFNAARILAEGKVPDGPFMATGDMRKNALAILNGAHPNDVLKSPKTNAFGLLLSLGADHPDDELGRVVVDRHAMSVAAGKRLEKADVGGKGENSTPIGDDFFYEHVADMYRHAARDLSEREGYEIAPHQLQAITWLRQQRFNEEKDAREGKGKGLRTSMRNAWGKWEKYAREHGMRTELGTTALPPTPVTAAEARGNSRPVSVAEFHDIATRGRDLLNKFEDERSPITGLTSNWDSLREQAFEAAQASWGGVTIDAHTGELIPDGADRFAVTVKPPGIGTISVPEGASEAEFDRAMDQALQQFGPLLESANFHLGIFHDDENNRIDIDPVLVVDSQGQAEEIGAYTHNIGGAYRFSDGNGYWPPHIAEPGGGGPPVGA